MNEWKDFFRFSKREQTAIIALLTVLLGLVLFISLNGFFVGKQLFQKTIHDSLLIVKKSDTDLQPSRQIPAAENDFNPLSAEKTLTANRLSPFLFNPNQLPEDQWKKMGLSQKQIRNIKNYEAKGGKFYKKEDLAKIYAISGEEYKILEPFIEIPSAEEVEPRRRNVEKELIADSETGFHSPNSSMIELNTADSLALVSIPNIGAWTAHRILKYRTSLGGFFSLNQLREVNGFDPKKWDEIVKYLQLDSSLISPLKINRLAFKDLLKHPYLEFEHTKGIVNYRETKGFIQDLTTFQLAAGLNPDQIEKIKPYLSFE